MQNEQHHKANRTITEFGLVENNVGDDGACAFADALKATLPICCPQVRATDSSGRDTTALQVTPTGLALGSFLFFGVLDTNCIWHGVHCGSCSLECVCARKLSQLCALTALPPAWRSVRLLSGSDHT